MTKPIERIEQLEQRVNTLTNAQGAQFSSVLASLKSINEHIDAFEKQTAIHFALVNEQLKSMQETLHWMAKLVYKKFGDNHDTNHERVEPE